MASSAPSKTALRVSTLTQDADHPFLVQPNAAETAQIAAELGFEGLRKLRFEGKLRPLGKADWEIVAMLGATVQQACVVTLEPVVTRIDTPVRRKFLRSVEDPTEAEMEMPEDDEVETLGPWIDPALVMIEALSIAAPDYPRKDDAHLGTMVYTKPGEAAMTDEDAKPFAGLAALKDKLSGDS